MKYIFKYFIGLPLFILLFIFVFGLASIFEVIGVILAFIWHLRSPRKFMGEDYKPFELNISIWSSLGDIYRSMVDIWQMFEVDDYEDEDEYNEDIEFEPELDSDGGDGGDITFTSGAGGHGTGVGISGKDGKISFVIGGEEEPILSLMPDGVIVCNGEEIGNDKEIIDKLRKFLITVEMEYKD